MLYTKPALNPKTALVVRTTQWDYEDRVKQEDLYVDGLRVATSHEFTLEEIIQPCLDLGMPAFDVGRQRRPDYCDVRPWAEGGAQGKL